MRSPLVTPTGAGSSGKSRKPRKPASASNALARQTKSQPKLSRSARLSGMLKKAAFPSKGTKTVVDPSTAEGKTRMQQTAMPQMDPLLTPSPRRSPRIATLNTISSCEDYSLSPLVHPDLFSRDLYRPIPSLVYGRCNFVSPDESSGTIFTGSIKSNIERASSNGSASDIRSTCLEWPSRFENHRSVRDYMKSGRPFPADESERNLKIVVRTGIRDLNDLAKELNSKATISSTLMEANISGKDQKLSKKTMKRSKSSSAKVNYSQTVMEAGKYENSGEREISPGGTAKASRKIYRTICSAAALPSSNANPSPGISSLSISMQEAIGESRVLKKRLFNDDPANERPFWKTKDIGSSTDAIENENVRRPESKGKKVWKRFSWNAATEKESTKSSQIPKNCSSRDSLDSKYTTLLDVDPENDIHKNGKPRKQTRKSRNLPRTVFKVLFDN